MFKYELGQTIYYLADNKVCSAGILSRKFVENLHEDWAATEEQKELFKSFGSKGVFYSTCHGVVGEESAFPTRDELTDSLM